MASLNFQQSASTGAQWCAVALGLSIPISAALDNVLLIAFILLWLFDGDLRAKLRAVLSHPVASFAWLFAAVMAAGMLWSDASAEQLREVGADALRFLALGLFVVVFSDPSTRDRAQFAFLVSSTLILILSFALASGLVEAIPGVKGRPDYPVVFKYHITHNLLMAVAALLFALHAMDAANSRVRIFLWVLAAAATLDVFLLIPGRTGQLALAASIVYLSVARLRWRGLAIAGVALLAIAGAAAFLPGSALHERSAKTLQESAAWQLGVAQPANSSVGLRMEFYSNSLELIAEHPVIGVGSGAFRSAYEAKVRGTQMVVTDHPHNAFLNVGVELGLIGLALLIILLTVQWRSAATLPDATDRVAARGMLVIFIAAGLVSSTFTDHAEGLFYCWASGLLFANARWPQKAGP